jgi:hypothetical protein
MLGLFEARRIFRREQNRKQFGRLNFDYAVDLDFTKPISGGPEDRPKEES